MHNTGDYSISDLAEVFSVSGRRFTEPLGDSVQANLPFQANRRKGENSPKAFYSPIASTARSAATTVFGPLSKLPCRST
jgi:hypothetical protein